MEYDWTYPKTYEEELLHTIIEGKVNETEDVQELLISKR